MPAEGSRVTARRSRSTSIARSPGVRVDIKRVIAEGDLVAAHNLVTTSPDSRGLAGIDIFRLSVERFQAEVPKELQPVFPHREYDPWIAAYPATDSSRGDRTPPSVRVPSGPFADIAAAWSGSLPHDPSRIVAPVLLVRGEWDSVSSAVDVTWLFHALTNAAEKETATRSTVALMSCIWRAGALGFTRLLRIFCRGRRPQGPETLPVAGRCSPKARTARGAQSARVVLRGFRQESVSFRSVHSASFPVPDRGRRSMSRAHAAMDSVKITQPCNASIFCVRDDPPRFSRRCGRGRMPRNLTQRFP